MTLRNRTHAHRVIQQMTYQEFRIRNSTVQKAIFYFHLSREEHQLTINLKPTILNILVKLLISSSDIRISELTTRVED
jgi:flagellar motor switch protein FliM